MPGNLKAKLIGVDLRCLMDPQISGVGEYARQLLDYLFKIDHLNQYRLLANSRRDVSLPAWDYPNVKLFKFNWPNKIFNTNLKLNPFFNLDKLLGGVDIFFAPNWQFIRLSSDAKLVLTVHDLSFEQLPNHYSFKRRRWHQAVDTRRLCQRADKIIAVSNTTRDDLVNLYQLPYQRIKVIYSGLSPIYRPLPKDAAILTRVREKYKLTKKFILSAGSFEPRKNLAALLKAFEKVPLDVDFVII